LRFAGLLQRLGQHRVISAQAEIYSYLQACWIPAGAVMTNEKGILINGRSDEVSQKPPCVKAKKACHYSTKRGCYLLF
jgi:hypothetical protein